MSERDLDVLLLHGIHVNLDAISQIERYGRRAPGSRVGIRIDPATGAGYKPHLEYSGDRPTKFGIGLERFDEALAAAARHDLVDRHDPLPRRVGLARRGPRRLRASAAGGGRGGRSARGRPGTTIVEVNVGGGLGVPARVGRDDGRPRRVCRRSSRGTLGPLGVTVTAEPGDALTKDAAILLGEVVTVEERRGVTFVGLDIGWNVNCAYFIYGFAQELVPCRRPGAARTVAGDRRRPHQRGERRVRRGLPDGAAVEEGEIVALLNAGGYLQAMSSTHCLRPTGTALFLER